jgi:sialate O-acetylesterase
MTLSVAMIFGNNMVLQRNKKIVVWGEAESGSSITVKLNGVTASVTAVEGKWKAELPPMEACTGCEMHIEDDKGQSIELKNVAIGEVWIAGGQSNMEMGMYADADFEEAKKEANNPNIRFFDYPRVSYDGQMDAEDYSDFGFWRTLTEEDIEFFSAVGHYFAKMLYNELDVPVGIVGCNWGGSPAAAWMDESYLTGELECYLKDNEEVLENLDMDRYVKDFLTERARMNSPEAKEAMKKMMKTPMLKPMEFNFQFDESKMREFMNGPYSPFRASGLYHTMLEKIMPYTAAGVIWYQGEADTHRANLYDKLFGEMIRCWRDGWNDENLPFLFVQLAPFEALIASNCQSFVPVREMQEKVSKTVPNSYMACIMDVGMEFDIHPKKKKPVGERLALLALANVYDRDILCESPEAVGMQKTDGSVVVEFEYTGEGLYIDGDKINALELYVDGGSVDEFTASVDGSKVRIDSPYITGEANVEVRFAWVDYCVVNLYNSAGLPAKPFVLKG